MRCEDFRADALVLGTADAADAEALRGHAAACPACRAALEAERAVEDRLRGALRVRVPDDLTASIHDALAAARPRRARWPLALAAALLVGVAGWLALRTPPVATVIAMEGDVRVVVGRELEPMPAALAAEQVVSLQPGATLTLALDGAEVRLSHEAFVHLHAGRRLTLGRGVADVRALGGATDFEIATPVGRARTRAGAFRVALDPRPEVDEMRSALKNAGLLAGGGLAGALVVWAWQGAVAVEGPRGAIEASPGQAVAVSEAEAPRVLADRLAEAEDALAASRRALDAEKAEVARLRAVLEEKPVEAPPGPAPTEAAPDPQAALDTIRTLARTAGMAAYAGLTPDSPAVAQVRALGPEGIRLMGELLRTGNEMERFVAAAVLEKLEDPSAVPTLVEALQSDDPGSTIVQRMVTHALSHLGGTEAVAPLESLLEGDADWGVKANAAYGLAMMNRDAGLEYVRRHYIDTADDTERLVMLQVMGTVGHPSYLPHLHDALKTSPEYSARLLAVGGLAKIGDPSSLPLLEAVIEDAGADRVLVVEAKKAYNAIADEDVYPLEE